MPDDTDSGTLAAPDTAPAPEPPPDPAARPGDGWTTGGEVDRITLLDGGRVIICAAGERWELAPPTMAALRDVVEGIARTVAASRTIERESLDTLRAYRAGGDEADEAADRFADLDVRAHDTVEHTTAVVFAAAINATKRTGPDADADRLPAWAGNLANLRGVVDHWRGNLLAPGT